MECIAAVRSGLQRHVTTEMRAFIEEKRTSGQNNLTVLKLMEPRSLISSTYRLV